MASYPKRVSQSAQALENFSTNDSGIEGSAGPINFRVRTFSENILQVTLADGEFDDFSYSVIAHPVRGVSSVEDHNNLVGIKTRFIHLEILKSPLRFRFLNSEGQLLNEEDEGLGTAWIGEQVTSYRKLQEGERFIGLGEKTGPLNRKGFAYQNWNTDAYAYHSGADPLYCSIPFYIGLHHGLCYGIFLDNSHKSFFNFGASNDRFSSFAADAGNLNYYFIYGHSVAEIIQHYTKLTGTTPLPPQWSIGFQQCRYSYYPDKEVLTVARTFREKDIPADVIVFDIHYMDKYKIFTWDPKNFPDPAKLIGQLKELGFEVVVMCDPGIKVEQGYEPYDDGLTKDVFLKYPDNVPYSGQVWPGWCHFPDFTNPKARIWWGQKFEKYVSLGIKGFWNDMNEIATWGNALPENLVFDFEGNPGSARAGRNVFGFQMARSTYEGTRGLMKGQRPFNLTRSGFAGIQRYAAVWTGDNVSYDEHMMLGVRMINSMGLSGIAFAGYDTGGFVGDASTKLFTRWISIGSLSPFFRVHTMINTRDSEPWSYGEEAEQISRNYIKLRYQLLPYLYSLFKEASETGMPVQRSLAINYSNESWVYEHAFHHQYLFGPFILVAPVESHKELTKVYLPAGKWYYLFDGRSYEGNQEIVVDCPIHKLPVFVKESAIIPMHKAQPNTRATNEVLNLHVYDGTSETSFDLYYDDGNSFEYESGKFSLRTIRFHPMQKKIVLTKQSGSLTPDYRSIKLHLHGFEEKSKISANGETVVVENVTHSFFSPLEKYDPINDPDSMGEELIQVATVGYQPDQIEISL